MARKPPESRDTRGTSGARRGRPPGKAGAIGPSSGARRGRPPGKAAAGADAPPSRSKPGAKAPTKRAPAQRKASPAVSPDRGGSSGRGRRTGAAALIGPMQQILERLRRAARDHTRAAGAERQARRRIATGRRSGRARSGRRRAARGGGAVRGVLLSAEDEAALEKLEQDVSHGQDTKRGGPTSPHTGDCCRRPLPKAEHTAVCRQLPIVDKAPPDGQNRRMALIGYARVSTEEQQTDPQLDALRAAGCGAIFEERASGGSRSRVELARCLERIDQGDTLVVVRIDRLARSLSHLLEVIERLRARGAHFRSLGDPIDTASPQGIFTLQVLGAAAELERALIRERTKAGLRAAKARGRIGGNPGLRGRDPERGRSPRPATSYLADLLPGLDEWLPTVRRLRPERP